MARQTRSLMIQLALETTYGTAQTLTATDVIMVSAPKVTPINANNVSLDRTLPYLGASPELVGTRYASVEFEAELAGSGVVGTAPAWGRALQCCGFAQTIAATRVDYLPLTDSQPSATIYINDSGSVHLLTGARGSVSIKLVQGEKPTLMFKFDGMYNPITATSAPATDYSSWKMPKVPTNANTAALVLGGTITTGATAPAITGGATLPSLGLEIDMGNQVQFTPLIGRETIDITGRDAKGKLRVDLTAAQEVSYATNVLNATTQSIGIIHGTTVGEKVALFLPNGQLTNYAKDELNGTRLISYDVRALPLAGNDEVRIVAGF